MPKISVVVPVYNVEPYIHRCVDSVLAQTFEDFELILVDDGSPDNCPVICDEYAAKDSRVVVIHQENGGLSAARNAGIDWAFSNSDSEWLSFIDSDDWVHPEYLRRLYQSNIDNNTRISFSNLYTTTGHIENHSHAEFSVKVLDAEDAYTNNGNEINAYACGRLYAKDLFSVERFPIGRLFEDTFVTHRIVLSQTVVSVINPPLYYYFRANPNSILAAFPYDNIDNHEAFNEQIIFYLKNNHLKASKIAIRKYLSEVHDRIQKYRQDGYTSPNVERLKKEKQTNFPKYAKYLDPDDPQDEWVLYKIYPFKTKTYIYWRAIKKHISRLFN